MRRLTLSENLTVFLLFFAMSVLDAIDSRVWWRVALWLGIALLFAVLAWRGERQRLRQQ
jgi:hypothetical protein